MAAVTKPVLIDVLGLGLTAINNRQSGIERKGDKDEGKKEDYKEKVERTR
jgi:hypothetical protein